jgi:sugar phosphate isomerase/epimerase
MFAIFENVFSKLAHFCKKKNICICIEANPKFYKNDFLIYTKEALDIIKKINSSNIKLNFDLGTAISNGEEYKELLSKNLKFIGHIQISLPKLKKITNKNKRIKNFIKFLKKIKYEKNISIEQLHSKKNNIKNVSNAVNFINNLI